MTNGSPSALHTPAFMPIPHFETPGSGGGRQSCQKAEHYNTKVAVRSNMTDPGLLRKLPPAGEPEPVTSG